MGKNNLMKKLPLCGSFLLVRKINDCLQDLPPGGKVPPKEADEGYNLQEFTF
jgi:hypothetical protein